MKLDNTSGPNNVQLLVAACEALGDPEDFRVPAGYPSLALCAMDAVWSLGVRYEGVRNVIGNYRELRRSQGVDADNDTPSDLILVIDKLGDATEFATALGNRQRTSSRGGVLKSEAVYDVASCLVRSDIASSNDIARLDGEKFAHVAHQWKSVTGQASGISWTYFLMLAGVQGVKADRMIRRFVADALER